jgi:hypothetical protein
MRVRVKSSGADSDTYHPLIGSKLFCMTQLYLRLILFPFALLTAALLVIHAQPYDDHGLRQLLLPDGCPAPCFMGIRPGVSTMDETVKILEASKWLKTDTDLLKANGYGFPLILRWNGNQPALLKADEGLAITFQPQSPRKVASISFNLRSDIPLGDLYLILGKASLYSQTAHLSLDVGNVLIVSHQFEPNLINVLTITSCPISFSQYWYMISATIDYGNPQTDTPSSNLKTVLHAPNCN